ncbi:hypothetical protein LFL96_07450 [Paraburkholderia sp. D15]|nr:hypothetical protein [Paraburkholderia sp. D15]WGS51330.1 hypothetical protein LFL96_07450 [Paraburkholderia sp. D15]
MSDAKRVAGEPQNGAFNGIFLRRFIVSEYFAGATNGSLDFA